MAAQALVGQTPATLTTMTMLTFPLSSVYIHLYHYRTTDPPATGGAVAGVAAAGAAASAVAGAVAVAVTQKAKNLICSRIC